MKKLDILCERHPGKHVEGIHCTKFLYLIAHNLKKKIDWGIIF